MRSAPGVTRRQRWTVALLVIGLGAPPLVGGPAPAAGAEETSCGTADLRLVTIDVPDAGVTQVRDLNGAGQVVGRWSKSTDGLGGLEPVEGFVHDLATGTFTPVAVEGAHSTYPESINDVGVVAGYAGRATQSEAPLDPTSGFRWTPRPSGGPLVERIEYPGLEGRTFAFKHNDIGTVVGYAIDEDFAPHSYRSGTSLVDVELPGAQRTYAKAINDEGSILGTAELANAPATEFVREAEVDRPLSVPCGFLDARDINAAGDIGGSVVENDNWHGVLIKAGVPLLVDVPGAIETRVMGIDELGQVAGEYRLPDEDQVHGFVGLLEVDDADLALTATQSATATTPGTPVIEQYRVTNDGPSPAAEVVLTISAGHAPVPDGCALVASAFECLIGSLKADESRVVAVRRTYTAPGTYTSKASVASPTPDGDAEDDAVTLTTTVNGPRADLQVTASDAPDPVIIGQLVTQRFTVTNLGPHAATGVVLTISAEDGAVTTPAGCTRSGSSLTCPLGVMGAGASTFRNVQVRYEAVGPHSRAGTVTSATADPDPANNLATVSTTVIDSALLTVSPPPGALGYISGPGISCGKPSLFTSVQTDCSERYPVDAVVDLVADGVLWINGDRYPPATTRPTSWGKDCAHTPPNPPGVRAHRCSVTMSVDRTVCAVFQDDDEFEVATNPQPIGCVPPPETYVLTVSPPPGNVGFISGEGIACGVPPAGYRDRRIHTDCSQRFLAGREIELTVHAVETAPAAEYSFYFQGRFSRLAGWGKACSGVPPDQPSSHTCKVTMTADRTVCAGFFPLIGYGEYAAEPVPIGCIPPPPTYELTVSPPPGANGFISGPGIACGKPTASGAIQTDCSERFRIGTVVDLTASGVGLVPDPVLTQLSIPLTLPRGWGKACVGAPPTNVGARTSGCSVTMSADRSACAVFSPVTIAGTAKPAAPLPTGCLPASPPPGELGYLLTVSPPPGANGYVSGPGISCGKPSLFTSIQTDCTGRYLPGTVVELTATGVLWITGELVPRTTSRAVGWDKDCAGTPPPPNGVTTSRCSVTMTTNRTVCAVFRANFAPESEPPLPTGCVPPPPRAVLTVSPPPTGWGRITGPGISCGTQGGLTFTDCSEAYVPGQEVVLVARPITLSPGANTAFEAWGQACTRTPSTSPTCTLDLLSDVTICATFRRGRTVGPALCK